jgi:hypothetical protein
MLEDRKIVQIAKRVANANLSVQAVETVLTEPIVDSEGRDAVRITIIIKPGKVDTLSGDKVLDTLYEIHTELSIAGEQRLPIVGYATREELEQSGAS